MAPNKKSKVGAPRLDPVERLLHRFYEPLVLLRILNAARGAGEVELPVDPRTRSFQLIWRGFLDNLSWLCDNKHGGETVSSVAAQEIPEGNKFWLVSKYDQSLDHLQWVLAELNALRDRPDSEKIDSEGRIAVESICFSKDKINTYARFLRINLGKARNALETEDGYGS